MPFFGAFGQAFGSSATLAASNAASSCTNKSSNTISNQGSFFDVTKDIELGSLPATSPTVFESGRTNNSTLREKLHHANNYMSRTGLLEFMKTILLTILLCLAIVIPFDLLPILNDEVDWSFAIAIKNIGVINGTVDYGNGTIAPLNNFNLNGSNLTISNCNYIAPGDLCTNNSHHLTSIRDYCYVAFFLLLTIDMFFFVAVGNGVILNTNSQFLKETSLHVRKMKAMEQTSQKKLGIQNESMKINFHQVEQSWRLETPNSTIKLPTSEK
ncbi:hypothetical protein EYC80_000619 [Monilinia laxa]|uniref:Uncharacterized protein n=1 Tax=Monilinia laxa TaxID=61186 RepID=A0A5N6KB78_MONLA|nr:hypothetical protein EYC80_000619 [Monilinia laxa]